MKALLTRERLIFLGIPICGLLLGLLGYMALVSPQKAKASSIDAQIAAAQVSLVAAHPQHVAKVSVQAADLFRLTKAMPDTLDMSGVLIQLSRLAGRSSVSLDSIRPSTEIPLAAGYAAVPLAITVGGSFADVTRFLQLLRQQVGIGKKGALNVTGRLMVANKISLATADGKTVTGTLNLDAFVYGVAPPPVAVGPTGAAGTTTTTTTTPAGSGG